MKIFNLKCFMNHTIPHSIQNTFQAINHFGSTCIYDLKNLN